MDPVEALNIEKRLGITNNDLDSFLSKVDLVTEAMEKIKKGEISDIEFKKLGIKTEEEEKEEEEKRRKKQEERTRKLEEKKVKEKMEEREMWWKRAEIRYSTQDDDQDDNNEDQATRKTRSRILQAYQSRDANDYSSWQKWEPDDPVSIEEKKKREEELEKKKNEAFEQSNPEFCQQFRQDMEDREKRILKKKKLGEEYKKKGNQYYKRKDYQQAISNYMKSIEEVPYNEFVLTNIAQSYLRLNQLDDTIEFCNRALLVNPKHVKAYSRRAAVYRKQGKLQEAVNDLTMAFEIDSNNEDLAIEYREVCGELQDTTAEKKLREKMNEMEKQTFKDGIDMFSEINALKTLEKLIKYHRGELQDEKIEKSMQFLNIYQSMSMLLETSETRVLFRTSGALLYLMNDLKMFVDTRMEITKEKEIFELSKGEVDISKDGDNKNKSKSPTDTEQNIVIQSLLEALIQAVKYDQRNQDILCTNEFICCLLHLLEHANSLICLNVFTLIKECSNFSRWMETLMTNKPLISALLKFSCFQDVNIMELCWQLLMILSCSSKGLNSLLIAPIKILKQIIYLLSLSKKSTLRRKKNREYALGTLSNLSTIQSFRNEFQSNSLNVKELVPLLLECIQNSENETCDGKNMALSSLSNLSLELDGGIRENLLQEHAISILYTCIKNEEGKTTTTTVRGLGILARLASISSALSDLTSKEYLEIYLSYLRHEVKEMENGKKIWEHITRILAASCHLEYVYMWILKHNLTQKWLETLPLPRISVVYGKSLQDISCCNYEDDILLSHITKCFIVILNDINAPVVNLFIDSNSDAIERLVEMLRNLSDGATRKNTAIVLAKLSRNECAKKKIKDLRGIEMMLSMSKALID